MTSQRMVVTVLLVVLTATGSQAQDLGLLETEARAAMQARFEGICTGDYLLQKAGKPTVSHEDLPLCLVGLESSDGELKALACLALEALASRPWFKEIPLAVGHHLGRRLVESLRSDHRATASGARRALSRIERQAPHLLDLCRCQAVEVAIEIIRSPAEDRWREAAILLGDLGSGLASSAREQVVAAVLGRLEPSGTRNGGGADAMPFLAVAVARLEVSQPGLAARGLSILLDQVREQRSGPAHLIPTLYTGIGRMGAQATGPLRQQALALLLEDLNDSGLWYTTTSGIRTPLRHPAADGLRGWVPRLDLLELERVRSVLKGATQQAADAGLESEDVASLFGHTLAEVERRLAALR